MLTVYLNQEILATQQNGADCLYSWTAGVLSPWYTQVSTQKPSQGQSLCTYEAEQTVSYHCTIIACAYV